MILLKVKFFIFLIDAFVVQKSLILKDIKLNNIINIVQKSEK